ncbi:MAG: OmpA family protein [Deltaproteobacteria bacterium]|nr:OmpA family protein [Deltaproteobacteria bacterium]
MGILPYVCRACRYRFMITKTGALTWIIILIVLLALAAWYFLWFAGKGNYQVSQAENRNISVTAQAGEEELKLREEVSALAGSLLEVRREKAALMAELALLRRELHGLSQKAGPAASYSGPQAHQKATRLLLGRVGFSPGSAELDQTARQSLKHVAHRLAEHSGARVMVETAVDAEPSAKGSTLRYGDNTGLAMARALSILRALQEAGVKQEWMSVFAPSRSGPKKDKGPTVGIWLMPGT